MKETKLAGEGIKEPERLEGRVTEWVDERGFGWVEYDGGSLFAHIREFKKGRVPVEGDELTFVLGLDPVGRQCATNLILQKEHEGPGVWACVQLTVLLVLPVLAGLKLPGPVWAAPLGMLVMSVLAWLSYRSDKRAAEAGAWRVSETMLHMLELFGGWPGAFLAQGRYRHKTRKASYQAIFQSIVFLYLLVSLDVVLDHKLWDLLVEVLTDSGILDLGQ